MTAYGSLPSALSDPSGLSVDVVLTSGSVRYPELVPVAELWQRSNSDGAAPKPSALFVKVLSQTASASLTVTMLPVAGLVPLKPDGKDWSNTVCLPVQLATQALNEASA